MLGNDDENGATLDSISHYIREFARLRSPKTAWLMPIVELHKFLPLYLGWFSVLGITCEGRFARWDIDDPKFSIVTNAYLQRLAIFSGIKAYPELKSLIPARPYEAIDCDACGGTGRLLGAPANVICKCCGSGWLVQGEDCGVSPG
jgi:hypothetical protein